MSMFGSRFLFWCAVWIAGSAAVMFVIQRDTDTAERRAIFALSTLIVAGLVWVVEHLAWRES